MVYGGHLSFLMLGVGQDCWRARLRAESWVSERCRIDTPGTLNHTCIAGIQVKIRFAPPLFRAADWSGKRLNKET